MDWNTLLTFALGGFTAVIPIIIANRYQAKERAKDRDEQRREAKIQNRQKWIERDILKIMESVDTLLKFLWELERLENEIDGITEGKKVEFFDKDEADTRMKLIYDNFRVLHNQVKQESDAMGKLVHSFDDSELYTAYTDYLSAIRVYEEARGSNNMFKDESDNWLDVQKGAAKLHALLRGKLISLRD